MRSIHSFVKNTAELLLFFLLIGVLFRLLTGLFSPLLFGFGIASALRPLTRAIARHTHLSGKASAILASGFFYLNFFLLLFALLFLLTGRVILLFSAAPAFLSEQLLPALDALYLKAGAFTSQLSPEIRTPVLAALSAAGEALPQLLSSLSAAAAAGAARFARKLPVYLVGTIFTVVLSVFIGADYSHIGAFLRRNLPERACLLLEEGRIFIREVLGQFFRAYLLLFLLTFAEVAVGLWLLGVGPFLSYALGIALFDLLPVVGSGSVLVPWGFLALLDGQAGFGAGLWILFGIICVLRSIIEPHVVGSQTGLHPVITITAMFAGLKLMGAAGVLALPLAVMFLIHLNRRGVLHLYQ